jgi:hypothetical protein
MIRSLEVFLLFLGLEVFVFKSGKCHCDSWCGPFVCIFAVASGRQGCDVRLVYVCMYVCVVYIYLCMYICYVCMCVSMKICCGAILTCVCIYVCIYVCTYVCVYACRHDDGEAVM